jgi:hypothetical protein
MRIKGLTGSIAAVIICFLVAFAATAPVLGADLTSVSNTLSSYHLGAISSHTVVFTTFTELPGNAKFVVTFEPGFNLTGATVRSSRILIGSTQTSVTLTNSPPSLILNKIGNEVVPAGSEINIYFDNVTNPGVAGTYAVSVKTTRSNLTVIDGPNSSAPFTIAGSIALTVTSASLPGGQVGTDYGAQALTALGGTSPYSWTKISGYLPSGLSLSSSGSISGTPDTEGSFNFTAQVRASAQSANSATKNFTKQ